MPHARKLKTGPKGGKYYVVKGDKRYHSPKGKKRRKGKDNSLPAPWGTTLL